MEGVEELQQAIQWLETKCSSVLVVMIPGADLHLGKYQQNPIQQQYIGILHSKIQITIQTTDRKNNGYRQAVSGISKHV
jgi:hypothetical protein